MSGYAHNSTLRSGSGFKAARKRLNPVSPKKAAERRKSPQGRVGGQCEIRAEGCTGAAIDRSHIIPRRFKRDDIKRACRNCHDQCHANPQWSYDNGHFVKGNGLPIQKFEAIFGTSPAPLPWQEASPSRGAA